MRGRRPQPTTLKILRGNPGKRPLNESEPKPDIVMPPCPDFIRDEAREHWSEVGPILLSLGVLTVLDGVALALLASALARLVKAEAMITQTGEVLKTKDGGFYQNPYLAVANKAWEHVYKLLVEFGMTPSSRSRIVVNKPTKGVAKRQRA